MAAVTADRAVTRRTLLTLYRQRSPEVGVPSENPKLNEPGLVITGFVDRVGDPAVIVAADGTTHRSETLVADALRALSYVEWVGLFGPRGTPREVIGRLNAAAVEALADPAVRARLVEFGGEIFPRGQQTPEALGALVKADAEKWWPIIKELGIKAE